MDDYKPRIVDEILRKKLSGKGAVLIEGPKWCGKTTTAEQAAKSILYMNEPKKLKQNLMLAETDPEVLLKGDKPRLIDEWQLAPILLNVKSLGMSSLDVANYLLEKAKIAAVPDSAFGSEGEGYIRISYAASYEQLVEACGRIRKAVRELKENE